MFRRNRLNQFKLMCYNIHKGKSFLTRKRVFAELKEIIHKVDADIVFLQEVRNYHDKDFELYQTTQLEYLSNNQYELFYGKNCEYKNGHHGNGILTKYPVIESQNFNITVSKLEKRGVFYNKLKIGNEELYTFCTHLNLRKSDRKKQIILLEKIIEDVLPNKHSNVLLLGDFNDFDNSIAQHFKRHHFHILEGHKTYPNFLPMFSPDKIFSKNLIIENSYVLKEKRLIAMSDHLPLISQYRFNYEV